MASDAATAASPLTAAILHERRMQEVCGEHMKIFYGLCRGGVEQIGLLFSHMVGAPMPPAVVLQMLSISEAQLQQTPQQVVPTATRQQFEDAMCAAVDTDDDISRFSAILETHISRLQHATSVLEAVKPLLARFHAQKQGIIVAFEKMFADLAPAGCLPAGCKGSPLPPGMMHALLRVPRDATTCTLDDVVGCFWRNLDKYDTAASISAVLEEHMHE
jgi:hypothetical protein